MVNEDVNFNVLKEMLSITDGNLASHLKPLEEQKYIHIKKGFLGKKTNTTYSITTIGEKAFREHIAALEEMLKGIQ